MMNRGKLEHILAYARQQKQFGSPTCRIPPGDMVEIMERLLAQPVSSGYKLMPIEPTSEMINAALASGALSIRTVYRVMLAAAPESGNDHDTRR